MTSLLEGAKALLKRGSDDKKKSETNTMMPTMVTASVITRMS